MSQPCRIGLCVTSRVVFVIAVAELLWACSSSDDEANSTPSLGGSTAGLAGGTTPLGLGGTTPLGLGGTTPLGLGGTAGSVNSATVSGGVTGVGGVSASSTSAPGGSTGLGGAQTGGSTGLGGAQTGGGTSAGGNTATGGTTSTGGATATGGSSGSVCPQTGHVSYTLAKVAAPTAEQQTAYDKITLAMIDAVYYYNCYTNLTKVLSVAFVPSVATADGNTNGSIRFGSISSMNRVTAMHEISHTVGIGTASNWSTFVVSGRFTGANALAQLLTVPNRLADVIGADGSHFWPYGLNYESEGKTEADLIAHCQMVTAMRKDLGLN